MVRTQKHRIGHHRPTTFTHYRIKHRRRDTYE